jgi:2-polyprenyl-6-methoxyphenol hydroxylase-like FAD-dependent oxidoreductase
MIVGGGIGGLSAALFLHRAGVRATVFEAAPQIRELGVGINTLPHAIRELDRLGLQDEIVAAGIPTQELAYFNKHGQLIWAEPRGKRAGYNWPQVSINRGRLQGVLFQAATQRLGADRIRPGHRFVGCEEKGDRIVARFENGATAEADILIGADGIHSAVRKGFYPDAAEPNYSGTVMWRSTTISKPFRTGATMAVIGHHRHKFTTYPITRPDADGNAVINWLARIPVAELPGPEDWNQLGSISDIVKHYEDWSFDWIDVPALMRGAREVFVYPMIDREPLPRWTFGRATLLGDAAHPMYPIGSNGGSQAILDGSALGDAFAAHDDPVAAMQAYEAARRPATENVVRMNRNYGPEIVMEWAEERAPNGFKAVEDVIPRDELEAVAARYRQTAGFDRDQLNRDVGR